MHYPGTLGKSARHTLYMVQALPSEVTQRPPLGSYPGAVVHHQHHVTADHHSKSDDEPRKNMCYSVSSWRTYA